MALSAVLAEHDVVTPPWPEPPVPNLPLLRKAMAQIKIRGAWDQASWMRTKAKSECGTAGCVAGWAVELTGRYELLFAGVEHVNELYVEMVRDRVTGEEEYIETVATRELGLTIEEADVLFMGGNDMPMLIWAAEQIAKRAGEVL